tara:strand:+ start:9708 stop:10679 length:972 start_codon:yes stop_codon:yes gene_type:complete
MPAEWEPHQGTLIYWPTNPNQYLYGSASDFKNVQDSFLRLVDVVSAHESVYVVADPSSRDEAESILGRRATIHSFPLDDAWARDAAPTIVHDDGGRAAVCWRFTGWGGRFSPIAHDARAAQNAADCLEIPSIVSKLGLEGGGVHSNGQGTLLTTTAVLGDPNRNPGRTFPELQKELALTLGASKVVSLPRGFDGDDTGGHVDVIASFAPDGVVLLNECTDSNDPNIEGSKENRRALTEEKLDVVSVPQPAARFSGGDRLAYSYLNFYPCNGAVIAPSFGDTKDDYFCGLLEEFFPDREIISIDARAFYLGGGGIHCVTQPILR